MWKFCGRPLFFSEAVPQVSQAFETQINFCGNRLKNQLAVTGYVTTDIGKTQECQLACMRVCAYKERWVFI